MLKQAPGRLIVLLAALSGPLIIVHSAGGRIEGTVTDPKGAAVVGASVAIAEATRIGANITGPRIPKSLSNANSLW